MATPILERRTVPGARGNILIEILGAGDRTARPAVFILQGYQGLDQRLARAGFTAISLVPGHPAGLEDLADVELVLAALDRGELGVPHPTSIGIVGYGRGGDPAIWALARWPRVAALVTGDGGSATDPGAKGERVMVPWLRLPGGTGTRLELDRAIDETTGWLARHLP